MERLLKTAELARINLNTSIQKPSTLPDNFFDDKTTATKIRGEKEQAKEEQDEEWKKYQQELEDDAKAYEEKMDKDEENEQLRRDLDDTKFQIHLYEKTDKLQDQYEEKQKIIREIKRLKFEKEAMEVNNLLNGNFSSDEEDEMADIKKKKKSSSKKSSNEEKEKLKPITIERIGPDGKAVVDEEELSETDSEEEEAETWRDRNFFMV